MNNMINTRRSGQRGMTLIEITLVFAILIALAGMSMLAVGGMSKWKRGKAAAEQLRVVYIAQKTYMADHPTDAVTDLTEALLIPYMPNGATAIDPVENGDGSGTLIIDVTVMPPTVSPDPSGKPDDGLWDVGDP